MISLPLYLLFGSLELGDISGSGFFVGEDLVVTNAHVVENHHTLRCELVDGRVAKATLVAADESRDLALLRISDLPGPRPSPLEARRTPVRPGEACLAIGFPGRESLQDGPGPSWGPGPDPRPNPTVTLGIVSAVEVELGCPDTRFLETDAALNPGNSGGPLLDTEGRVVGVNVRTAVGKQGEGYAVPIGTVLDVFEEPAVKR